MCIKIIFKNVLKQISGLKDLIWVKINPVSYAKYLGVEMGDDIRLLSIRPGQGTFGSEPYLIKLGSHVTITGGVNFVNHDGGVWIFREREPDIDVFGKIIVGDNVFIGINTIIMPGVKIGSNVVIGAGSIVTKDIPDNVVAAGSPARVIKTIEEYKKSISSKKDSIRSFTADKKKEYLKKKFYG